MNGSNSVSNNPSLFQFAAEALYDYEIIDLAGNQIGTLQANSFSNLHMCHLDLSDNQIRYIEANAFANSTIKYTLNLLGNNLHRLDLAAFDGGYIGKLKITATDSTLFEGITTNVPELLIELPNLIRRQRCRWKNQMVQSFPSIHSLIINGDKYSGRNLRKDNCAPDRKPRVPTRGTV